MSGIYGIYGKSSKTGSFNNIETTIEMQKSRRKKIYNKNKSYLPNSS